MSPGNDEVIVRFYEAFAAGDPDTMATCYHERAHFSDPVFTDLNGPEVMKMWRLLIGRSDDIEITLGPHSADEAIGSAHWSAVYTFSQTGRVVHNEIDARFRFEDGLIIDHRDTFSLWRWSRMALGLPGVLLGWSPIVQGKIRRQSAALMASAD
ncbi:MAG: nuclear transport factor 2 family protein [Solirubrobacterales bacterium]|nr:nuclear transport factor 2 family protein [Solirubrobacterales bacterium]